MNSTNLTNPQNIVLLGHMHRQPISQTEFVSLCDLRVIFPSFLAFLQWCWTHTGLLTKLEESQSHGWPSFRDEESLQSNMKGVCLWFWRSKDMMNLGPSMIVSCCYCYIMVCEGSLSRSPPTNMQPNRPNRIQHLLFSASALEGSDNWLRSSSPRRRGCECRWHSPWPQPSRQ